MKQKTVKSAAEAWKWIDENPHHICGTEWHPSKKDADGMELRTHMFLQNYHEKLRIPEEMTAEVWGGIEPNARPFDTRMYAITDKARLALSP